MSQQVTKPYYIHLITTQAENPPLLGFAPPQPASKVGRIVTAGWSNVKRDPLNNKTVYKSIKPAEYRQLGKLNVHELEPLSRLYKEEAVRPKIQTTVVRGSKHSGQEFGRAFGFY